MKAEFLAEMTHELRSPLNTILGFAELMHEGSVGPVADDHREYLGDILTSGRHLLRTIDDLLDVAKLEAGQVEVSVEAIDLVSLVGRAGELVEGRAAHRHIRIRNEVDAVTAIAWDVVRLRQIVVDALSNAVNCTPVDGVVTVRALPEGAGELRLDVEGSAGGRCTARFSAVLPRTMAS